MRIQELVAYHVRIPLRSKVKHASHTRTDTDSILVCCRLDDGTEGWGEGLPREYVTGETIETAVELFRSTDWRRQLGEAFSDVPGAWRCAIASGSSTGRPSESGIHSAIRSAARSRLPSWMRPHGPASGPFPM